MDSKEEYLKLFGHRIVPTAKCDGSVRKWRCVDCGSEASSAEDYSDRNCNI